MNLNEYQELSKRTMPKPENMQERQMALLNYSMGAVGETAEVLDEVKKIVFHGHSLNPDRILSEAGDSLHYIAGLCTLLGFTLEDAANHNIKKLSTRYPDGFSKAASIARVDTK